MQPGRSLEAATCLFDLCEVCVLRSAGLLFLFEHAQNLIGGASSQISLEFTLVLCVHDFLDLMWFR